MSGFLVDIHSTRNSVHEQQAFLEFPHAWLASISCCPPEIYSGVQLCMLNQTKSSY
jgi:small subunit ribosomal protein S23e